MNQIISRKTYTNNMKVRLGFVSNSSSSSYLILGFPLEENQVLYNTIASLKENKSIEAKTGTFLGDHVIGYYDDYPLFGSRLAWWDYDSGEIDVRPDTLAYLNRKLVEETKDVLGIDISKNKFSVFGRTRYDG